MSSGNDKEIRIGITAETSGAEKVKRALEEVKQAATNTDGAIGNLGNSMGGNVPKGNAPSLAKGMVEAAEKGEKAAVSTRNFGGVAQQVGYQVQDMAVQIAGGTDALVAIAQQGSQLLGIFGPGGAVAGALLSLGAVAVQTFLNMEEGSEDAEEAAENYIEALEKIRQKLAETAAERGRFADDQFRESIDKEAGSFRRLNDEMARNIQLSQAKRNARNEIANAQDAADLAAINSNKDLSEADKIRKRGEIESRADDRRAQDRLDALKDQVKQAQADADTKAEAAKAATNAASQAQQALQSGEARRDELKPKAQAKEDLAGAEKALTEAESRFLQEKTAPFMDGPFSAQYQGKQIEEAKARVDEAKAELERLRSIAANEKEIAELHALESGGLEERKKTLEEMVKNASKARDEASSEAKKSATNTTAATTEAEAIIEARLIRRKTQAEETETEASKAEDRKKKDDQRKLDHDKKEKQRQAAAAAREQEGIARDLESAADKGESIARKNPAAEAGAAHFEKVKAALSDGASKQEIAELVRLLGVLASLVGDKNSATSSEVRELRRKVQKVEAQLNKSGDIPAK